MLFPQISLDSLTPSHHHAKAELMISQAGQNADCALVSAACWDGGEDDWYSGLSTFSFSQAANKDTPSPPLMLLLCHRRRVLSMLESQSKPSNKPSPLIADVLKIAQSRFLMLGKPSPSATSASDRAPGRSCRLSTRIFRKCHAQAQNPLT